MLLFRVLHFNKCILFIEFFLGLNVNAYLTSEPSLLNEQSHKNKWSYLFLFFFFNDLFIIIHTHRPD